MNRQWPTNHGMPRPGLSPRVFPVRGTCFVPEHWQTGFRCFLGRLPIRQHQGFRGLPLRSGRPCQNWTGQSSRFAYVFPLMAFSLSICSSLFCESLLFQQPCPLRASAMQSLPVPAPTTRHLVNLRRSINSIGFGSVYQNAAPGCNGPPRHEEASSENVLNMSPTAPLQ